MTFDPIGSNQAIVCKTNALKAFWDVVFERSPAWVPVGILILMVVGVAIASCRPGARAWIEEGACDITGRWSILGLLILEAMLMIVAFAPYLAFGDHDQKIGYSTFALPCLAAIVGGGGLIFDRRDRLDFNGWAYFLSAVLLFVAFMVFIWDTHFFNAIVFLFIPTVVVAAATGLFAYSSGRRKGPRQDCLYQDLLLIGVLVVVIMGFLFYFIFMQGCHF